MTNLETILLFIIFFMFLFIRYLFNENQKLKEENRKLIYNNLSDEGKIVNDVFDRMDKGDYTITDDEKKVIDKKLKDLGL